MSSTPVPTNEEFARGNRLQLVLMQHWAEMITSQREELAVATRQIATLDERATQLYNDNVAQHGMLDQALNEINAHETMSTRMLHVIERIFREDAEIENKYRGVLFSIMAEFSEAVPVDLTTEEELDDDL